jgi:hypothetical protein
MITKASAINSLRPKSNFVMVNDSITEWLDASTTAPTDAEIDAEFARLQAEYEIKEYQRGRATAYPSIQEQLDMQYWDSVNGTTTWADAIAAVKQEFPKP